MASFQESITCEQVFSRSALGFLWAKRDQLDPGQRTILDALYMGRKKGSIDGSIKVEYRLPKTGVGKLGFGRAYGTKGSLETLERECRGTMCREFYDDVDVINCHPVLLHQLAQRNYQVELPEVEKYCDNRTEYLKKISDNKEEAKQAVIKVFYNGKNDFPHLAPMSLEIRNFIKKHLMEDEAYRELLAYVRKQENNTYGSFLSHILQTEERKVMMAMRQSFLNQGFNVDVLAYDGVMLRKGKKPLEVSALREAEDFIHRATGYRINLLIKPFEFFEVTDDQKEETEEVAPKVKKVDYERNKTMFEDSHFYFATTNEIVEVAPTGRLNYEKLEHAQIKYVAYDFKHSNNMMDRTNFVKLWLNDPSRRTYHTIDMRPSEDPMIFSPPVIFRYTTFPRAENAKAIWWFDNLIRILSNNNETIYEYIYCWLAHMIQRPFENPGTAIFFTGQKGCGKDTLGDFLVQWIVGSSLAHNYDSTAQFWEKHDTSRENRILIKLEEVSGVVNRQHVSDFKARITSADLTVNEKGKTPRTSANYNHYIGTTNEGQPVKVEEGERRYNVFACSPEWVGQFAKWTELRTVLFCPEGASVIGHYLAEMDLGNFDPRKMPENEYLEQAIDAEISPEKAFINQWSGESITMAEFYDLYTTFCQNQKMNHASNSKTLGLKLMEYIRDGLLKKTRGRMGMMYSK
jgi:hypothetical protein